MNKTVIEKVLIAVPCFNEASALRKTIKEILEVKTRIPYADLVVVDDGSTDNSIESISDLDVTIFKHPTNMGLGASFMSAMEITLSGGYDCLITIDADGQFLPTEIPRFLSTMK